MYRSAPLLTVNGSEKGDKTCPGSPSNSRNSLTRLSSLPEGTSNTSTSSETRFAVYVCLFVIYLYS